MTPNPILAGLGQLLAWVLVLLAVYGAALGTKKYTGWRSDTGEPDQ